MSTGEQRSIAVDNKPWHERTLTENVKTQYIMLRRAHTGLMGLHNHIRTIADESKLQAVEKVANTLENGQTVECPPTFIQHLATELNNRVTVRQIAMILAVAEATMAMLERSGVGDIKAEDAVTGVAE